MARRQKSWDDASAEEYGTEQEWSDDHRDNYRKNEDGTMISGHPYRARILQDAINSANNENEQSHDPVLLKLQQLGVRTYIIAHTGNVQETFQNIHRVIQQESKFKTGRELWEQPCLLYKDDYGRLYNLTLQNNAEGLASSWKSTFDAFSGLEAMIALVVMTRTLPCASSEESDDLKPAYLGLLLGLVFTQELSLPWLNTSMFVMGTPSIAAHSLNSKIGSDWLRKLVVLSLTFAGASNGDVQRYLTLFGVGLACVLLLVNLGSRAWHFLGWRPLTNNGWLSPYLAFISALVTGVVVPYMGFKEVRGGGKLAIESIIKSAFIVSLVFVLSDYDEVQKFIVFGSEGCSQDTVNIAVGVWWALTLIVSICMVKADPDGDKWPLLDEEPLLEEDQASPVGYRVPGLPSFPVDPGIDKTGIRCFSFGMEVVFGLIMAAAIGGGIIFLAFTDWDEEIAQTKFNVF